MSSIEVARLRAEGPTYRNSAARMRLTTDRERLLRMAQGLEVTAAALEKPPHRRRPELGAP